MVRLTNIQINGGIAECDIFPENSLQAGHIAVDTKSGKLLSYTLPEGYAWCMSHVAHAKNRLCDIVKRNAIEPGLSVTVAWY